MNENFLLMSINKVGEPVSVLSEGNIKDIMTKFDELTYVIEEQGVMMVNEVKVGKNSYLREFATKEDGWAFTLITGGNLEENTSVINEL